MLVIALGHARARRLAKPPRGSVMHEAQTPVGCGALHPVVLSPRQQVVLGDSLAPLWESCIPRTRSRGTTLTMRSCQMKRILRRLKSGRHGVSRKCRLLGRRLRLQSAPLHPPLTPRAQRPVLATATFRLGAAGSQCLAAEVRWCQIGRMRWGVEGMLEAREHLLAANGRHLFLQLRYHCRRHRLLPLVHPALPVLPAQPVLPVLPARRV